jgi:hypothetical protein
MKFSINLEQIFENKKELKKGSGKITVFIPSAMN